MTAVCGYIKTDSYRLLMSVMVALPPTLALVGVYCGARGSRSLQRLIGLILSLGVIAYYVYVFGLPHHAH